MAASNLLLPRLEDGRYSGMCWRDWSVGAGGKPLLQSSSAPAEAVEAIHGVMPPVLFQGFLGPLLTT